MSWNLLWLACCNGRGLNHHHYTDLHAVLHKRLSSSRGKAKRQACNAPDRRLIRRPSKGGGRDKEDMPRMHCCLGDALFNSADNQIQLVQRFGGEVALSALERSWWESQNTCYSVERQLWLGHIHCWATGFKKKKKKADTVDIHHLILCDFEDIYIGQKKGNKCTKATLATVLCLYLLYNRSGAWKYRSTNIKWFHPELIFPTTFNTQICSVICSHTFSPDNNITGFYLGFCNGL